MTTALLVTILGLISSATLVLSALSVHRGRLLSFSIVTGILVAVQYTLNGSAAGFATNLIGTSRNAFVLGSSRKPWLNHWVWVPVFILVHAVVFSLVTDWGKLEWYGLIPLVGGVGGVIAVFFRKVKFIKMSMLALGSIWMVYEFNNHMFTYMIGESFNFVANSFALITLLAAERKGLPASSVEDLDTRFIETITQSIPVITKEFHTITRSIHLPTRKAKLKSQMKWLLTGVR